VPPSLWPQAAQDPRTAEFGVPQFRQSSGAPANVVRGSVGGTHRSTRARERASSRRESAKLVGVTTPKATTPPAIGIQRGGAGVGGARTVRAVRLTVVRAPNRSETTSTGWYVAAAWKARTSSVPVAFPPPATDQAKVYGAPAPPAAVAVQASDWPVRPATGPVTLTVMALIRSVTDASDVSPAASVDRTVTRKIPGCTKAWVTERPCPV